MTVSEAKQRFRAAFLARTMSWNYVSESQANMYADCALAQACVESANFTSPIWQDDCNPIGYKYYSGSLWQSGKSSHTENGEPFARFATVENAAKELADWVHRRAGQFKDVGDVTAWANAMKANGYFASAAYDYANAMLTYYNPSEYVATTDNHVPSTFEKIGGYLRSDYYMWIIGGAVLLFVVVRWIYRKFRGK